MADSKKIIIDDGIVLPPMYQRVEYLQSTGGNWILTDVKGYASTIGIKAYFAEGGFSGNAMGAGYRANQGIGLQPGALNLLYYYAVGPDWVRLSDFGIASAAELFSVEANYLNSGNLKANDIAVADGKTFGGANFYITIFAFNLENYLSNRTGQGKITKAEITDGDQIIREFIPCYRIEDGVAGMFDVVTETFYTNAGTGEFAVGADVFAPEPEEPEIPEEPETPALPKIEFLLGSPSEIRRRMMMTAKTGALIPANNQIIYQSTTGNVLDFSGICNATLVSNEIIGEYIIATFSEDVKTINNGQYLGVKYIDFPETCTTFGRTAFDNSYYLERIIIRAKNPT